jgi:hypothetical protein
VVAVDEILRRSTIKTASGFDIIAEFPNNPRFAKVFPNVKPTKPINVIGKVTEASPFVVKVYTVQLLSNFPSAGSSSDKKWWKKQ